MAKKQVGVWGIDIGQCAFKALRCVADGDQVIADSYEYIEYPKMLSQPEADAEELVREALEQFVERNELKGDRLAIAVPGQSGLAKFFKPPPVELKKIPDLVKFEARQQIPFDLQDVIWDYQQFGGVEADGFVVDTEIGLFAMKREQVLRALEPYDSVGLELDIVQLAPMAIYNFVTYEMLSDVLSQDFNPDDPPESLVVLSMGTDTTDLVITNGFRMWQRSIPLGGNHFTRQLTKSMKLTFAKAEHLKRNARQAEDPKKVFTAMRPVFNDMLNEVQRSIGYFQGLDRKAKIGGVLLLGNTVRLPGLKQFLAKNLGYDVVDYSGFQRLGGGDTLSAPAFKDNILSYGVCYGLCLQGLGKSALSTNLLPPEIITERLVRAKKPWAVAAVAALVLACWSPYLFEYDSWRLVKPDREVNNVSWQQATQEIRQVQDLSSSKKSADDQLKAELQRIRAIGEELVGNADRRLSWLELLKAVNDALPTTPGLQPGEIPDIEEVPIEERQELHIEYLEDQYFDDLTVWFNDALKRKYIDSRPPEAVPPQPQADPAGGVPGTVSTTGPSPDPVASLKPLTGPGWVIELSLHHFYNKDITKEGATHVQQTLLKTLETGSVVLPAPAHKLMPGVKIVVDGKAVLVTDMQIATQPGQGNAPPSRVVQVSGNAVEGGEPVQASFASTDPVGVIFTYKELGISYPTIIADQKISMDEVPNPAYTPPVDASGGAAGESGGAAGGRGPAGGPGGLGGLGGGGAAPGAGAGLGGDDAGYGGAAGGNSGQKKDSEDDVPATLKVRRYDCIVQFAWQETLLTARIEAQNKAWLEAQKQPAQPATGTGEPVAQLD